MQHFGLPQLFHGLFQEERAPTQIHEKSVTFVQSGDVQTEEVKETVVTGPGEVLSHEQEQTQTHEGQALYDEAADGTREAPAETPERQFEPSPEPPIISDEIPVVLEFDSPQQETPGGEETRPPNDDSGLENPLLLKEAQPEEQTQQPPEEVRLEEEPSVVETLVDAVKEKVSAVTELLFDDTSDVIRESEEAIDTGRDVKEEEIILIREKLRGENPEMFFSESSSEDNTDDETEKDGAALREELALLQVTLKYKINVYISHSLSPTLFCVPII